MYRVIYLWRSERHVHSASPCPLTLACELVALMRADRWQAWWEPV